MKKIVIIGGGISGLSAGIYAQQNGFESIVLERHDRVGGLCTWWERKGYHIDGCVHWLTGTHKDTDLYNIWKNLGVITDDDNIFVQKVIGVMDYQGEKLTLYADPKKLKEEFLRVGPNDKRAINRFFKDLRKIMNVPLPLTEPVNTMSFGRLLKTGFKLFPYIFFMARIATSSCEKYCKKFKSPILRFFFNQFQPGPGSAYALIYSFGTIVYQNGGIPKKVSKGLVNNMEERYLSLGGTIRTKSPVIQINIDKKKTTGVTLDNGEFIAADYVVSAVDANVLLNKLLVGKYKNKPFNKRFDKSDKNPCPSAFLAYYAVDKEKYDSVFHTNNQYFPVDGLTIGKENQHSIVMRSFGFDDYFDRNGKTVMEVYVEQYHDSYDYWKEIFDKDKNAYYSKKKEISNQIVSKIVSQYPEFSKEDFEYLDSLSPLTFERYTDAYKGSYMSFMVTSKNGILMHSGHIHGINNLYLASQWCQSPGGLPLAAATGMFAIQRILKHEKRNYLFFKASKFKYSK